MPSSKSANPTSSASPSALKAYLLAARPRTWSASLCPVWIGAWIAPHVDWKLFGLTLGFSLFIQIGTNYANDYFDFQKGADTAERIGPKRAVQQGWISPASMLLAAVIAFGIAILLAIPLMLRAGLWSLPAAALCVLFGVLYTGGPKPLGYLGLGETLVFLFFGPVAVCGTYFLQTMTLDGATFIASLAPGLLSCSILIANNLRDEQTDRAAGKRTLAVRFGRYFGAWEYTGSLLAASLVPLALVYFYEFPLNLASASLLFFAAIPSIRRAFEFKTPLEAMPLLQNSALLLLVYTILFCWTI